LAFNYFRSSSGRSLTSILVPTLAEAIVDNTAAAFFPVSFASKSLISLSTSFAKSSWNIGEASSISPTNIPRIDVKTFFKVSPSGIYNS